MPADAKHKIDWAGAATLSVALAALTLVTSLGGQQLCLDLDRSAGAGGAVVAALLAFVGIEARRVEPILPLELFRQNVFATTSAHRASSPGAGMLGAITFLPIYLQIARGAPTVSGLMLVPMTAGIILVTDLAGRYMGQTGRYRVLPLMGMALADRRRRPG